VIAVGSEVIFNSCSNISLYTHTVHDEDHRTML